MAAKQHLTSKQREALNQRMKEYHVPQGNAREINEYKQGFWEETARKLNALEKGNTAKPGKSYKRAWSYMVLINARKKKPEERNAIEKEVIISNNLDKFLQNQNNKQAPERSSASGAYGEVIGNTNKAHKVTKRRKTVTFGEGNICNEPSTSVLEQEINHTRNIEHEGAENNNSYNLRRNKETNNEENDEDTNDMPVEKDTDNSPQKKPSNENNEEKDQRAKKISRKRSYTAEDLTRNIIDSDDTDDHTNELPEVSFQNRDINQEGHLEQDRADNNRPSNSQRNKEAENYENDRETNDIREEMDTTIPKETNSMPEVMAIYNTPKKKASHINNGEIKRKAKEIYSKISHTSHDLGIMNESEGADDENNESPQVESAGTEVVNDEIETPIRTENKQPASQVITQPPWTENSPSTSNGNPDSQHYSDLINLSAAVEELQKIAHDRVTLLAKQLSSESKAEELYGQIAQYIQSIAGRMKK